MKFVILVALICLVSALALSQDLAVLARKESRRRQEAAASRRGTEARVLTNVDLDRYRQSPPASEWEPPRPATRPPASSRDLVKEKAHWQKEKEKHLRGLAQLDARIRRLEWRLAERKARRRPGERLRDDPTERALEESLDSMREERKRLVEDFHEKARKAGALPGWLR